MKQEDREQNKMANKHYPFQFYKDYDSVKHLIHMLFRTSNVKIYDDFKLDVMNENGSCRIKKDCKSKDFMQNGIAFCESRLNYGKCAYLLENEFEIKYYDSYTGTAVLDEKLTWKLRKFMISHVEPKQYFEALSAFLNEKYVKNQIESLSLYNSMIRLGMAEPTSSLTNNEDE